MQPKISITVKLLVEGIHSFPEAEEMFPEVGFLKYPHRHNFDIECEVLVSHTNRDKEYICFKREVMHYLTSKYFDIELNCCNFKNMSCEMISLELFEHFKLETSRVGEDGEFHSTVKNIDYQRVSFLKK